MANNIYIGNRYVPVFANPVEWDNLREYEPLTIVTYNGTAYTSKQTVPVGTALSNTDYWVVTGNYNAQVEEYRQEVIDFNNKVEARRTYYSRDYGVIGNGVVDDTNALQNFINNYAGSNNILVINAGTYHTTNTIELPDNCKITGESIGSVIFLDNFTNGCFKLSTNCWLENLLFLTSSNGVALYGSNVSSINLYNIQNSGQTIGSTKHGSGFLKLEGDWNTVMIENCLVDSGGNDYAIVLRGQDNWGGGTVNGDRDIYFRNCYIDNFFNYENKGGTVYANSVKDLRFNGCIVRGSSNTFVLDNTYANQEMHLFLSNCIISRSTTNGYVLTINNTTTANLLNTVVDEKSHILNNGVLVGYDNTTRNTIPIITDNYFTKDEGINVVKQGNGSYFIEYNETSNSNAIKGIWKNVNTAFPIFRVKAKYLGKTVQSSSYGIALRNSSGNYVCLFYLPNSSAIVVSKWTNNGTVYNSDIIPPIKVADSNVHFMIHKLERGFEFLYSLDDITYYSLGIMNDNSFTEWGIVLDGFIIDDTNRQWLSLPIVSESN